jgi:hypothetical protein
MTPMFALAARNQAREAHMAIFDGMFGGDGAGGEGSEP